MQMQHMPAKRLTLAARLPVAWSCSNLIQINDPCPGLDKPAGSMRNLVLKIENREFFSVLAHG